MYLYTHIHVSHLLEVGHTICVYIHIYMYRTFLRLATPELKFISIADIDLRSSLSWFTAAALVGSKWSVVSNTTQRVVVDGRRLSK